MDQPLVSIRCLVYNHEKFLRQCLEGFVMQQCSFPFVAVVHDDASTDGSAAIIKEYAQRYPDIIKPIFEQENLFSKHDGSLRCMLNQACLGKYIAFCEGDDYWTDPLKLQKQVTFLEDHPDYALCFHRARMIYEDGLKACGVNYEKAEDRDYGHQEMLRWMYAPTASMVLRREVLDYEAKERDKIIYGDQYMVLCSYRFGKVRGMSDFMSVYRFHRSSMMHDQKFDDFRLRGEPANFRALLRNFHYINGIRIHHFISQSYWKRSRIQPTPWLRLSDKLMSLYTEPLTFLLETYRSIRRK